MLKENQFLHELKSNKEMSFRESNSFSYELKI